MRQRLKFRKTGPVRFVGHLDLMRTMQKTFRRANIPIAYSEGFSPHQTFSFATALAVGVSSEGEYVDLKLTEDVPVEVIIAAVNAVAPNGVEFIKGVVIQEKEPKAMAALVAARYRITSYKPFITETMLTELVEAEELIVEKRTKKGTMKDFDVRPGIIELTLEGDDLIMLIATGSTLNIKPEMILQLLTDKAGISYDRGEFGFHRIELYHQPNETLESLIVPKLG